MIVFVLPLQKTIKDMKKTILMMLLSVWGLLPILAQEKIERKDSVKQENIFCDLNETQAYFRGGPQALRQYLEENVDLSVIDGTTDIQGRVVVSFVVEKDGEITNAKVVKSVHPALDAEALRVVNSMPKWTPGMQKGEPVRVKYTVPVTFRLQGKDSNIGNAKANIDKGANVLCETVVVGFGKQDDAASAKTCSRTSSE